jgi:hypothetical protein
MLDDHIDEVNLRCRRNTFHQEFAEGMHRGAIKPDNRADEAAKALTCLGRALDARAAPRVER